MEESNNMESKEIIVNIKKEAQRILEDCEYSSKGHLEDAKYSRWCNYFLMFVSIVSVCGGLAFMYSDELWNVIIATISGIITMLLIFLNPQEKYLSHHNSGNKFLALRNETRIFLEIESKVMDVEQQMQILKKLDSKRSALNEFSLPISRSGYESAKKQIETDKNTQHRVDKGQNECK